LPPGRAADANDVGYTSSTLFAGVDGSRPKAQASRRPAMHADAGNQNEPSASCAHPSTPVRPCRCALVPIR